MYILQVIINGLTPEKMEEKTQNALEMDKEAQKEDEKETETKGRRALSSWVLLFFFILHSEWLDAKTFLFANL